MHTLFFNQNSNWPLVTNLFQSPVDVWVSLRCCSSRGRSGSSPARSRWSSIPFTKLSLLHANTPTWSPGSYRISGSVFSSMPSVAMEQLLPCRFRLQATSQQTIFRLWYLLKAKQKYLWASITKRVTSSSAYNTQIVSLKGFGILSSLLIWTHN